MTVDITRFVRFCLKPYGIIAFTLALSFAAWILPIDIDKGFYHPEPLFSVGGLMLIAWYGSIALISVAFFAWGRKVRMGVAYFDRYASSRDNLGYFLITLVAAIGVYYTTEFFVGILGWRGIQDALLSHQGNVFRQLLEVHYMPRGIVSLRYCAILSGGLALYRFLSRGRFFTLWTPLDLFNFFLLSLTALYNSRLSFVAGLIFGCGLYVCQQRQVKIHILKGLLFLGIVFGLLTFFSASRTMGYYQKQGIDSASGATGAEITRYLAAPFQTSLAVGNKYTEALKGEFFTQLADVESILNANSAFYELTNKDAWMAWPIIWMTTAIGSWLMGTLSHHIRNFLFLAYLGLLYAFGEIWRIFMFYRGILITMVGAGILLAVLLSSINVLLGRRQEDEPAGDEAEIEADDGILDEEPSPETTAS